MSWLSSFTHPGKAYDKARQEEEKYFQQGQQMRQPFIEKGQQAGQFNMDMLQKLMNPQGLQDEWSQGYSTSPYAQQMQDEAQSGGMDAASAMGLGGSSAALENVQKGSADIMQKDRQQYMDDMMKKYMAAMGMGESMYGTGANMANQGASATQQFGQNMGANAYGKGQAGGDMFGKGAGFLMDLAKQYMTGGMGQGSYGRGSWSPLGDR
jgi:hypothetical protein